MARDADSLKITTPWAKSAPENRQTPEDAGIDRSEGWTLNYTQIGGKRPERKVWNQLLCEITSLADELNTGGSFLPWDIEMNYAKDAWVRDGEKVYVSLAATGPDTGNATQPSADTAQAVWRVF